MLYYVQTAQREQDSKQRRPQMMHPDQLYTVRQLQHQVLLAEAERVRACGERGGTGVVRALTWLAASLKLLSVRRGRPGARAPRDSAAV
jgi:hypothetical protein